MVKIIVFLIAICILTSLVLGVDCPRGIVNDPYPGICSSYTDQNKNGVCDLSETETISNIDSEKVEGIVENVKQGREYYFIPISIVLILLYAVSFILSKIKKISIVTHRKIWNIFLLFSFLGVAIFGIILVLRVSFGISILSNFNVLFWHVETGIAMSLIALFHVLWHLPYFKSYFR